jgi:hypothetical protein
VTELEVPEALEKLVLACLAKNPDERPTDAGDLRERLRALGLDSWTRERARQWWETHQPGQPAPCDPCDQGEVRPVFHPA